MVLRKYLDLILTSWRPGPENIASQIRPRKFYAVPAARTMDKI